MDTHKCTDCENYIEGPHDGYGKYQYARCRAEVSSESVRVERVSGVNAPDAEKFGYCQTRRDSGTCPDFKAKEEE